MADPNQPPQRFGRVSLTLIFMRLLICSLAFFAAAIAASLVGTFGLFRGLENEPVYSLAFLTSAGLGLAFISAYALVPFAVLVILTEAFAWRAMLVFAIAGGVMGGYFAFSETNDVVSWSDRRVLVASAAGIVGGWVYWALAGRKAGAYRERLFADPSAPASPEASEQTRP